MALISSATILSPHQEVIVEWPVLEAPSEERTPPARDQPLAPIAPTTQRSHRRSLSMPVSLSADDLQQSASQLMTSISPVPPALPRQLPKLPNRVALSRTGAALPGEQPLVCD
jgi:hypothetical protein